MADAQTCTVEVTLAPPNYEWWNIVKDLVKIWYFWQGHFLYNWNDMAAI